MDFRKKRRALRLRQVRQPRVSMAHAMQFQESKVRANAYGCAENEDRKQVWPCREFCSYDSEQCEPLPSYDKTPGLRRTVLSRRERLKFQAARFNTCVSLVSHHFVGPCRAWTYCSWRIRGRGGRLPCDGRFGRRCCREDRLLEHPGVTDVDG